MKKSLLALAVLGAFAGAASAQSSVTIYGLLDLGVTKGNGGTAGNNETNPGANGTSEAWIMKQASSSRLGFRGNEDLGGGLSAQFQIEHRFTPDDGLNPNAAMWQGRSYVQLTSAAAGSVYLGREYTPAFWPAVKADPFGWDGVGQVGFGQYAGFRSASSAIRTANTLGYRSPNMGGLTVQAAVALGEAVNPRDTGFNVEYGAGPIYAGFGYERLSGGPIASQDGNSFINFSFAYDLGMIRPVLYLARAKVNGGDDSNSALGIYATAPIGAGKLKVAYNQVKWDDNIGREKSKHFGIGYDYPLSKRTNVYVDVGNGRESGLESNTAYAFGVKHTF